MTLLQYWFKGDEKSGVSRRILCLLRPDGRWSWLYESTDETPDQCGLFHCTTENLALHDGIDWYYYQDFDGKRRTITGCCLRVKSITSSTFTQTGQNG